MMVHRPLHLSSEDEFAEATHSLVIEILINMAPHAADQ